MGEYTDKIIDVEEDKRVKDLRKQINDLRTANTELRKQVNNKGIPINVRDELFATIDENTEKIDELMREMKKPTIVPLTEAPIVANHTYEDHSSFGRSSFRF